jgi:hypothetical protein
MKMKNSAILLVLLALQFIVSAQNPTNQKQDSKPPKNEGKVEVYQDSRVDSIVKMHVRYNSTQSTFEGYRIQIFFDAGNNSLSGAQAAQANYQMLYPGDTAYISFVEPYYKVRIGDFRTRLEAESYLHQIIRDFPNAFIIKDKILFPKMDED